jgi:NitT/TauT family transport system substrate-binding protein
MRHYSAAFLVLTAALLVAACSSAPSAPAPKPAPPQAAAPATKPAQPAANPAADQPPLPAEPETLTYGYVSLAATQWALYVAEARGYFTEQRIALEESSTGSAAGAVQALAAGSLDIISSNPDPLLRAVANGADLVLLAGTMNPPIYSLYGQKGLGSVAELRGKTIVVGGPKDVTVYLLERMLVPNGLQRTDYEMVYAGGTPDRLRALQSGGVDAAILYQPFEFVARDQGYPLILDTAEYVKNLPFSTFTVTRAWLGDQNRRERAIRFLMAVYRGAQEMCDPSQKEAIIRILTDKTGLSEDHSRKTYELLIEEKHSMKCDLSLTADELQQVNDYIVAMGDLTAPGPDPRRLIDTSYLDQAVARLRR